MPAKWALRNQRFRRLSNKVGNVASITYQFAATWLYFGFCCIKPERQTTNRAITEMAAFRLLEQNLITYFLQSRLC
jgi:hypothetical protein